MTGVSNTESYTMKWARAERELAARRIIIPTPPKPKQAIVPAQKILRPSISDKIIKIPG